MRPMKKKVIFDSNQTTSGEKKGLSAYPATTASQFLQFPQQKQSHNKKKISSLPPKAKAALGSIGSAKAQKQQPPPTIQKKASKELLVEEKKNEQQLEQMVTKSQQPLLRISSVFPFDLFPDEVTIDATKVNIVQRNFWKSGSVHSVYIRDIADVKVEATPFFAKLQIVDRAYVENKLVVTFLKKNEAYRARRILQGLVVATKDGLNLAGMEMKKFAQKIEELGVETETKL